MRRLPSDTAKFLIIFACCGLAVAASSVAELTSKDFDDSVKNSSEGPWFVKFYAPWCGHCKSLAPTWEQLAVKLEGIVRVAKVDATVETELAKAWEVDSFPTLKLFVDGAVHDYEGRRTLEDLGSFARGGYKDPPEASTRQTPPAHAPPPSLHVVELTSDSFDNSVRKSLGPPWFVKFYAPWCGHCKNLAPTWETLGEKLKGRVIVAKVDAESQYDIAEDWNITAYPSLRLIADGQFYIQKGPRTIEALEAYALGDYKSTPGELLPARRPPSAAVRMTIADFYPRVSGRSQLPWFINFYIPTCRFCKDLAPHWERLATELVGEVNVAKVDAAANRQLAEVWGVGAFPTLHLIHEGRVYEYSADDRRFESLLLYARGGYRAIAPVRILPEPSFLERYQVAIAFVSGFLFVGTLAWCLVLGKPQVRKDHDDASAKKND